MSWADSYLALRELVLAGAIADPIGRWALEELAALAPHHQRAIVRDRLLVSASSHLTGSTWARAGKLRSELLRCHGALTPARQLLTDAVAIDPNLPRSQRQLYTILSETEIDPIPIAVNSSAG